ncbi:D-isomer specific 2-hydroxyacid dehydrogenase family protein [Tsukamurella sp. 8F]|uniref:D-isomer specific 2-hydroxyacid dehydrogenase family protein n=1 Tax=unclassified Tsukamurella TaxID=2633480 RepID=UPI0023B91F5C|nr:MULTISPECIES: D-isomer specific 2-hydroxyacid dehydrogenase family protein [unclassified Tsukamurella]MDF0531516.1 D-isomer specific 2-hydroxyacid dehydrogenase family protein [Tsukamurella sp. 8J]MDF0588760.1 D-isomer specific 2-hydroxyacid dehydrogenase family protein [Tsukamurella sp. 8F]
MPGPQTDLVVAVGPDPTPDVEHAVRTGGGVPGPLSRAGALVWTGGPADFPELPESVRWVQLPAAGVEKWVAAGIFARNPRVQFTSAAGVYADAVAEHALTLLLMGVRGLWRRSSSWDREVAARTGTLAGSTVAIIGAGGIGRALVGPLLDLHAKVIAVNRSGRDVPGALVRTADEVDRVWDEADHVVLAAPATPGTKALVGAPELARLKRHSWVVNVARGTLVDTDALVDALRGGAIGGAGLDVVDPEPLPGGHPLWALPNAIITPHVANPPQLMWPALLERIEVNVRRVANGREPLAPIDAGRGY